MNPEHAVDIYIERPEKCVHIHRRRDATSLSLPPGTSVGLLGAVVSEGLVPKESSGFQWVPMGICLPFSWEQVDCVTVIRRDGKLIVATPFCSWGKAPDIVLARQPKWGVLGEAIFQQADYPYTHGLI